MSILKNINLYNYIIIRINLNTKAYNTRSRYFAANIYLYVITCLVLSYLQYAELTYIHETHMSHEEDKTDRCEGGVCSVDESIKLSSSSLSNYSLVSHAIKASANSAGNQRKEYRFT